MESIEDALNYAWADVMEAFNHPPLDYPKIDNSVETAAITMTDHKISVSRKFVNELTSKGLKKISAVKSLLMHETNHYMYCPFEMSRYMQMLERIKKHSKIPQDVCNYYMDVIINLDLMRSKDSHIVELYRVLDKECDILRLTVGIYEQYSGKDLCARIDIKNPSDPLTPYLKRLLSIDYSDERHWNDNAEKFALIIKNLEKTKTSEPEKEENPLGKITGKSFSQSEQKQIMKELAEKLDPKDFRKFVKKEDMQPKGNSVSKEYYDILSKKFPITIIPRGGNTKDFQEHKKWGVDDPVSDIDVFNSYGKIFPGITHSWKNNSTITPGKELPDLFIAIDSSCSMTNPGQETSLAVLTAFCLAKNYLANGKSVAIYNFSDTIKYTQFSRGNELFENILHYTGGGTYSLEPLVIEKKIGNRYCDIAICSDMDMVNIDDVLDYLVKIKNVNRVSLLCIDDCGLYSSNEKKIGDLGMNTTIIRNDSDIKKIVIGAMSGYT